MPVMAESDWRHEQAFMEHGSGVEGAEMPPGPVEDGEVAFDGPRFVRELAGVLGMQPGDVDEGDSEEGSSFFSPRGSSDSESSASLEPGAALCSGFRGWNWVGAGFGHCGAAWLRLHFGSLRSAVDCRPVRPCIQLLFRCALPQRD